MSRLEEIDPAYASLLDWLNAVRISEPATAAVLAMTLHALLEPHAPGGGGEEARCRRDGEPWPCAPAATAVAVLVEQYDPLLADDPAGAADDQQ